jgi:NADPH-dependent ferric siderophore reductase
MFASVKEESSVSQRWAREQKLGDGIAAMGPYEKSFFHGLCKLGHGMVFQQPQHPDKLSGSLALLFFLYNQSTA